MVGEVYDPALDAARQRQGLAVGGDEAGLDGVDAADDRGGAWSQPTDLGFAGGAAGCSWAPGLGNDEFGGQAALDGLGDAEYVVFARACEGLLLAAGIVSLPLEDPGLVQVVQDFTADGVVEVELEAVDVVVGGDEGFGGDDVEGDVGAEAARIGMVAAVTGARRAPGGLRRAGGVGELREDGRAAGGDQALLLEAASTALWSAEAIVGAGFSMMERTAFLSSGSAQTAGRPRG